VEVVGCRPCASRTDWLCYRANAYLSPSDRSGSGAFCRLVSGQGLVDKGRASRIRLARCRESRDSGPGDRIDISKFARRGSPALDRIDRPASMLVAAS